MMNTIFYVYVKILSWRLIQKKLRENLENREILVNWFTVIIKMRCLKLVYALTMDENLHSVTESLNE